MQLAPQLYSLLILALYIRGIVHAGVLHSVCIHMQACVGWHMPHLCGHVLMVASTSVHAAALVSWWSHVAQPSMVINLCNMGC